MLTVFFTFVLFWLVTLVNLSPQKEKELVTEIGKNIILKLSEKDSSFKMEDNSFNFMENTDRAYWNTYICADGLTLHEVNDYKIDKVEIEQAKIFHKPDRTYWEIKFTNENVYLKISKFVTETPGLFSWSQPTIKMYSNEQQKIQKIYLNLLMSYDKDSPISKIGGSMQGGSSGSTSDTQSVSASLNNCEIVLDLRMVTLYPDFVTVKPREEAPNQERAEFEMTFYNMVSDKANIMRISKKFIQRIALDFEDVVKQATGNDCSFSWQWEAQKLGKIPTDAAETKKSEHFDEICGSASVTGNTINPPAKNPARRKKSKGWSWFTSCFGLT